MSCVSRDSGPSVTCNGRSCHSASGCEVEIVGSTALLVVAAIAGSVSGQCHPCVACDDLHIRTERDKILSFNVFICQLHGALVHLLSLLSEDEIEALAVI